MPEEATRLARVQRRFGEFASEYAALPLYLTLCRHLSEDEEAASLLMSAQPGQARPVLWLAALHDLVLRRPDVAAARWYASVVGRHAVPTGDPWPDVRRTAFDHWDELAQVIATRGTQTNEVNRAVYVSVGLAAATRDLADVPVALVELGASAGLLLGVDRYAVDLLGRRSTVTLGDPASPVRCSGVDRAEVGQQLGAAALPPVVARVGLDLSPVSLDDDDAVRWLEACLWPDVPGRVERFRAACDVLRGDPPLVLAGNMVDGLPHAVARARGLAGTVAHVVVVSSWALTYVAPPRRIEVAAGLDAIAGDVAALSWLTAEPPDCAPGIVVPDGLGDGAGGTVVALRRWRDGHELDPVVLGACNPHGHWIDLGLEALGDRTS